MGASRKRGSGKQEILIPRKILVVYWTSTTCELIVNGRARVSPIPLPAGRVFLHEGRFCDSRRISPVLLGPGSFGGGGDVVI